MGVQVGAFVAGTISLQGTGPTVSSISSHQAAVLAKRSGSQDGFSIIHCFRAGRELSQLRLEVQLNGFPISVHTTRPRWRALQHPETPVCPSAR